MKVNIMQPCSRDQVPMLSYIATIYLITIGIFTLLR
jgi:hypothetical protein